MIAAFLFAQAVVTLAMAETAPTEPTLIPSFANASEKAESILRKELIDPDSLMVEWTSGFRWGFAKPSGQKKIYGWVACGKYNSRNRMGGYAGFSDFSLTLTSDGNAIVMSEERGGLLFDSVVNHSSCRDGISVPINSELKNFSPLHPLQSPPDRH